MYAPGEAPLGDPSEDPSRSFRAGLSSLPSSFLSFAPPSCVASSAVGMFPSLPNKRELPRCLGPFPQPSSLPEKRLASSTGKISEARAAGMLPRRPLSLLRPPPRPPTESLSPAASQISAAGLSASPTPSAPPLSKCRRPARRVVACGLLSALRLPLLGISWPNPENTHGRTSWRKNAKSGRNHLVVLSGCGRCVEDALPRSWANARPKVQELLHCTWRETQGSCSWERSRRFLYGSNPAQEAPGYQDRYR